MGTRPRQMNNPLPSLHSVNALIAKHSLLIASSILSRPLNFPSLGLRHLALLAFPLNNCFRIAFPLSYTSPLSPFQNFFFRSENVPRSTHRNATAAPRETPQTFCKQGIPMSKSAFGGCVRWGLGWPGSSLLSRAGQGTPLLAAHAWLVSSALIDLHANPSLWRIRRNIEFARRNGASRNDGD